MKLSDIKKNPENPRTIRGEQFERLKRSIREFPQMMALRPIVTDSEGVVLGGNMRLEALKALGYKEVPDEWVKRADELTEEQRREFAVKDNAGFGDWDWDALANGWDDLPLQEWGLPLGLGTPEQVNYEKEWQGMPEYGNEDLTPAAQLTIYFATVEDKLAFGELIGQGLTDKTRWVWHPARPTSEPVRWME